MTRRDAPILAAAVDAAYALLVDFPIREAVSGGDGGRDSPGVLVATPLGTALRDAQALYDRLRGAKNRARRPTLGARAGDALVWTHDACHGAAVDACVALRDAALYTLGNPYSYFSALVVALAAVFFYLKSA